MSAAQMMAHLQWGKLSGDQTRIADFAATPNHNRPTPAAESRQGICPCRNPHSLPRKSPRSLTAGVQLG